MCWDHQRYLSAYLHHLPVHQSWAFWTTYLVTAIVFSVLAVGEWIGDKLPNTPNRISLLPYLARLGFGGLVGAIAATGSGGGLRRAMRSGPMAW